jgi:hypothetical protein
MTFPKLGLEIHSRGFVVGVMDPAADGNDSFQIGFRHRSFYWRILIGRVVSFECSRWVDDIPPRQLGLTFGRGIGWLLRAAKNDPAVMDAWKAYRKLTSDAKAKRLEVADLVNQQRNHA